MEKKIKIVLGFIIFLAIFSGLFLIFAKKKTVVTPQTPVSVKKNVPVAAEKQAEVVKKPEAAQDAAETMKLDWQACKNQTADAAKIFFWKIAITEEIPKGGTYAIGYLAGLSDLRVRITIKSDAADKDKIQSRIVLNKNSFLRGKCIGIAPDGAVSFEAF